MTTTLPPPASSGVETVALHQATRERYLNYALSVITARALPDVRDGLKPVQRRILYAMYASLRLLPDARYRKSAAVVGEVMAKFHPHGDQAIYDALVRMSQPFSLRHPLIHGQGNFGSLDGDGAAAMRYTECRLAPIAVELLSEIKQRTVDFRPNYDGQHFEPVVLPAQFPQLLVNGAEGVAVGMATRIPPHNLREVIDAAVLLIDEPDASMTRLVRKIKGPDFPTGGVILNSTDEIRRIYKTGQGSIRIRARWRTEQRGRKHYVVVTDVPYGVNKAALVEKIGQLVAERKVPQIVDVRDESTDEVRVLLELRKATDAETAMAFLFKHTALQTTFPVNLTCLAPSEGLHFSAPARLDLSSILRHWLDFRHETVRRRFQYDLEKLRERIHVLEALARIFDALDEAIRLVRTSEGKRDAAEKLMDRFDLDDIQADAILELRLYKLARLEIAAILEELEDKLAEAERIEAILSSRQAIWDEVKRELREIRKLYGEARRTDIGGDAAEPVAYEESAYIVAEDTHVIVTRDGWIKRQGTFSTVDRIRVREGDRVGWIALGSTRATVTFFTDRGSAYTMRVDDVPATTGYGEPVQRYFNFGDGEQVVGVALHDPRALPTVVPRAEPSDDPPPPWVVGVTRQGRIARLSLASFAEPSTRSGRRYMRPGSSKGKLRDGIVAVHLAGGGEQVSIASEWGRALCFDIEGVGVLRSPGKGVTAIKLREGDRVFAFELTTDPREGAHVVTAMGREEIVRPTRFKASRGGKGRVVLKRGRFVEWKRDVVRFDRLHAARGEE